MEEKVIIIVITAALLLGCVIAYFYYVLYTQHKKIMHWQEERVRVEINTLESERKKIAIDMHDDIGPLLSAVKIKISAVECTSKEDDETILESTDQINEVITKFRTISNNLLPNALLRNSIKEALTQFILRVKPQNLSINLNTIDHSLPEHISINTYRIIQEIIHNTIKHSKASLLSIDIEQQLGLLVIKTQDNGIGFVVHRESEVKSIGMLSIHSRVSLMNGSYNIASTPETGTAFIIKIPIVNDNLN